MNAKSFENIINEAWNNKGQVNSKSSRKLLNAISKTIDLLDVGKIRVAEKKNNEWTVNQWIKNEVPWAKKFSDSDFINYKTDNLSEFLKKINLLKAA